MGLMTRALRSSEYTLLPRLPNRITKGPTNIRTCSLIHTWKRGLKGEGGTGKKSLLRFKKDVHYVAT